MKSNKYKDDLINLMAEIAKSKGRWSTFTDFVKLYVIVISNSIYKAYCINNAIYSKKEKEFSDIINKYPKED